MHNILQEVYADSGKKEKELINDINESCMEKWRISTEFLEQLATDVTRFVIFK